jgi:hypothetical protein
MSTRLFLSILALAPVLAFAQITETRNVDAFTGVRSSALVTIELKSGSPCSVTLEGEADAIKTVTTEVKDGMLVVAQDGHSKGGPVALTITVSDLKKIDVGGPTELKGVGTFAVDSLRIEGSGGADIDLNVAARIVDVDLSGASTLHLCGTATTATSDLSGASDLRSGCLDAQKVDVSTSGAASASVMASQSVNAKASGASDVLIYGDAASRTVEASGSSSIETKSGSGMGDTTKLSIGGRHIDISHDPDELSDREKDAEDGDFEFWDGFDLGVNGLMTYDNQVAMPQGLEPMDLNYAKSYVFGWNAWQKNIHIYRNNVNLGTGIGLTWYHYNLRGSYTLQPNMDYSFPVADSINYSRNRLNVAYVNIPLFLEFNTNNEDASRSFHIGGGVQAGYNVFKNKVKQKYELDGRTYKRKIKDDYNVNPFKIDLIGRIGYGKFSIFATYSLTPLFEENKGPRLYPWTAGISLDF